MISVPSFRLKVCDWLAAWDKKSHAVGATCHICQVTRPYSRGRPSSHWLVNFSAPWVRGGFVEFQGNRRAVHEFLCSCTVGCLLVKHC